jgi:hypothetical protein
MQDDKLVVTQDDQVIEAAHVFTDEPEGYMPIRERYPDVSFESRLDAYLGDPAGDEVDLDNVYVAIQDTAEAEFALQWAMELNAAFWQEVREQLRPHGQHPGDDLIVEPVGSTRVLVADDQAQEVHDLEDVPQIVFEWLLGCMNNISKDLDLSHHFGDPEDTEEWDVDWEKAYDLIYQIKDAGLQKRDPDPAPAQVEGLLDQHDEARFD